MSERVNPTSTEGPVTALMPAAAYVRMSTEHQRYSADNQLEAIDAYAAARGFQVSIVYSDLGKSGLTLAGRPGLQQLLRNVTDKEISFKALLVYDVSRWGRFQDPDEAAAYELMCKREGVAVHYCAECFDNDGSVSSSLLKAMKRVMAGEFSRELSVKTRRGQLNLMRKGFHVGGPAPFGMRRVLCDADGERVGPLAHGQWKAVVSQRVILMPGPEPELEAIRRICSMYLDRHLGRAEIARILNSEKVPRSHRARWTDESIRNILTNEKYAGQNVWGQSSLTLGAGRVHLPAETWMRQELCFPPIISPSRFEKAKVERRSRSSHVSNEEILSALSTLAERIGRLSRSTFNAARLGFSSHLVRYRFGGMTQAYDLIGHYPGADYTALPVYREIRSKQKALRD